MQANMTAVELKEQGNRFFMNHRYEDAIGCYSKAIVKNPEAAPYFTNRALCYLHTKQWDNAAQDCRKAVELDRNNVKAHFFLGKACFGLSHWEECIKALSRAHDLSKGQRLNYGDEICSVLRAAKRAKFDREEERRCTQEVELQVYLTRLIEEDRVRRRSVLTKESDEPPTIEEMAEVDDDASDKLQQLNALFQQVDDRRQKREVPDHLCGKISFELLRDPVITPSGITYDRKDIIEHLQRVGHFDPVTRSALTQELLTPNLAMKDVVDHFLHENPWANAEFF